MTGIPRVVVDVGDRREVHVHADRARFDRGDPRRPRTRAARRRRRRPPSAAETPSRRDAEARRPASKSAVLSSGSADTRLQPVQQRRGLERLAENHGAVRGCRAAPPAPAPRRRTRGRRRAAAASPSRTSASNASVSLARYVVLADVTTSCPTLSSSVIFLKVSSTHFAATLSSASGSGACARDCDAPARRARSAADDELVRTQWTRDLVWP